MICTKVIALLFTVVSCQACITLLDNKWRPHTIEDRAAVAEVVLSTRTLNKFPIPNTRMGLYGANFEVLSILKGWSKIEELLAKGSPSVQEREKLVISALGFGDRRRCWSSVEIGETYILFLSVNNNSGYLVAKYLGAFGAAELLYAPSEEAILLSLGWKPWSTWSSCSSSCGGGIRRRKRQCISKQLCHGPYMESKKCNTFGCVGTVEVLKEIEKENINTKQSNLFRDGSLFGNGLGAAPSAMTYLLFPQQFPSEFSILATIKAALFLPRFLFSLYDANNRMLLGLKLGPGLITVHYGGQNDVSHDRTSHSFAVDLRRNEWHQIGISVTSSELIVTESCAKIGKAPLNGVPAESFDIFGAVYIGADESEGASKNFLGQVSQLTIVPDPAAVFEHCGRQIFFPSQRRTRQPSPPYVEGPSVSKEERETEASGSTENYVDQENGSEVDEEHGSGQVECNAHCLNGGKCVNISKCSCPSGWGGDDCSQAICNPPCENGGNCLSPGVCKCSPNYGGSYCQKAICKPSCLNGGICTARRFKCKCRDGYFGKACEHRICTRYVTKQVSYLRPVTRARIKEYKVPCGILNIWKCTKSRLVYYKAQEVFYRQEYGCAK